LHPVGQPPTDSGDGGGDSENDNKKNERPKKKTKKESSTKWAEEGWGWGWGAWSIVRVYWFRALGSVGVRSVYGLLVWTLVLFRFWSFWLAFWFSWLVVPVR